MLIIFFVVALIIYGLVSPKILTTVILMLLPIIISLFFDKSSDKCLLLTVSLFNIGAILISGAQLIFTGDSLPSTGQILKNVYMSSAIGFIFYLVLPTAIKTFTLQVSSLKRRTAREKIKQIESSWD